MGRKVLLIIDVQTAFLSKETLPVVDNIRQLLNTTAFDLIIQSRWENCKDSLYETQLGYCAGMLPEDGELAIQDDNHYVCTRIAQYSCVTEGLLELLRQGDEIYICGLEIDACVLSTCFSLWDAGFKFKVLRNCTGSVAKYDLSVVYELIKRQFSCSSLITGDI